MKELVTIQLGDFANYVGSHFWNFQDELLGLAEDLNADSVFKNHDLNMDVLYRTGSLGSLSSHGTLYKEITSSPSDVVTWAFNL
nr:protein misato homolog 1 isoform X3 [Arachis hypogaea]